MKIDLHSHILPYPLPDFKERYGCDGWINLEYHRNATGVATSASMFRDGRFLCNTEPNFWDPMIRIKYMDQCGVSVQVISTMPVMFSYWAKPADALDLARLLNDNIAKTVSQHPTRFIGMGMVPLQSPELAIQEMTRCVKELKFMAIQIGTHVNDWNLDAPELRPFFAAAEQLNCSLYIHPNDMDNGLRHQKYWFPWLIGMPTESTIAVASLIFGGVLEEFPKLKVCFPHGVGAFPFLLGRLELGFNRRPDLCAVSCKKSPKTYIGRIWADSLVHDEDSLIFTVKKLGSDRIVLGSGCPLMLREDYPGKMVEESSLDNYTKENILYRNALNFLSLNPKQFQSTKEEGLPSRKRSYKHVDTVKLQRYGNHRLALRRLSA